MEELTTFYFADKATLKDCLTMADCLSRPDIDAGFVTFSKKNRTAVLGFRMDEDAEDFGCNLLTYPSIPSVMNYQQPDQLDQTFDVTSGLRLALLDFDTCQTKKMADVRSSMAKECHIEMEENKPCKKLPQALSEATPSPSNSSC